MTLFRTLLWWLLLAAFGALAWDLLSLDVGEMLIRWHGSTVTTTVAFFLVAWALLWFLAWALWQLLRLPFTGWQRLAQAQARNRLINGLVALHEGRNLRAETLLDKAAEDDDARVVARLSAREAALRRGDVLAAAGQQAALTARDPAAAALNAAEAWLAQGKPEAALETLQPWLERRALPPRGVMLQGLALAASGRASQALALLPALATEQDFSAEQLQSTRRQWQAEALRQSSHANELQQRWLDLDENLRKDADISLAYARRAAELGLEAQAETALAEVIDHSWTEELLWPWAQLPSARDDQRLPRAGRWLPQHPSSAALALALGRLCQRDGQLKHAEESLHRALALGAGSAAWEELGRVYTAMDDAQRAQACYANALRTLRGEAAHPLGGRSLRELIADEAIAEHRDEHGLPHLPR